MAYTVHEPAVLLRPELIEIGEGTRIDALTKIEGGLGVRIGRWVHVASFCHVNAGGGEVVIGDGVGFASGVVVCGGVQGLEGEYRSPVAPEGTASPSKRLRTVIEDGACIFAKAVICPGVTVGARAVVAAGAVVTKDVGPGELWAGVPARRVR